MIEKIKLTQAQADGIERYKQEMVKSLKMQFKNGFEKTPYEWAKPLVELGAEQILDAVQNGYEVKPKFKVGDWVHVSWSNGGASVHKVLKIGVRSIGGDLNGIAIDAEGNPKPPLSIVRHATAEEIAHEKEQRLWKSIGREVGEFKADEIGYLRNGAPIRGRTRMTEAYEHGDLIGFYPIESFIDFGGDE